MNRKKIYRAFIQMIRAFFLIFLLSLVCTPSMAAFQNARISPSSPLVGDQVAIVLEVTRPDLLGIASPPNIIAESSVSRNFLGNQVEITVTGTGGGFSNPSDQGEVVIPIGRFSQPGPYVVELLVVASTFGGSGMNLVDTLGFEVVSAVPVNSTSAILALAVALLLVGGVSINSRSRQQSAWVFVVLVSSALVEASSQVHAQRQR